MLEHTHSNPHLVQTIRGSHFLPDISYFIGPWKPSQVDNPAYKGEWEHPQIDNPEYEADENLYKYDDFGVIGFDLWQVGALL